MKLPKYVFIQDDSLALPAVLQTGAPNLIGRPTFYRPGRDDEKIDNAVAGIANERFLAVKIPGYIGFMIASGSLTGKYTGDREQVIKTLREMADHYLTKIEKHKSQYKIYKED